MKYLLVLLAVLMAITGAGIVIIAALVGAYTGNWTWMLVSVIWFGISMALAGWLITKFNKIKREERGA